jgi:hypothetical protein
MKGIILMMFYQLGNLLILKDFIYVLEKDIMSLVFAQIMEIVLILILVFVIRILLVITANFIFVFLFNQTIILFALGMEIVPPQTVVNVLIMFMAEIIVNFLFVLIIYQQISIMYALEMVSVNLRITVCAIRNILDYFVIYQYVLE